MKTLKIFIQTRIGKLTIGALFLALTSCSNDAKFSGGSTTVAGSSSVGLQLYQTKSDFVTTSSASLDLVWVIDDSGSMQDDIARVRSNFGYFITGMQLVSNFKMALITQKTATSSNPNSLVLADFSTAPNLMQIDTTIDSHNALAVTAAALCLDQQGACGISKITAASSVMGHLGGFLRQNSKKVFIFATDDNASITSSQFISAFQRSYPGQIPTTFAFVGVGGSASPCQAATGTNYQQLAKDTAGAYFNICNTDWTSTFTQLANNVMQLAQNTVQLPAGVTKANVVKVEINGVLIDPSHYSVNGDGVLFDGAILNRGVLATVSVYYSL
jgi:hypothetical protein